MRPGTCRLDETKMGCIHGRVHIEQVQLRRLLKPQLQNTLRILNRLIHLCLADGRNGESYDYSWDTFSKPK
jgi:hypothetical protein